jgi:hypothetical protein
MWQVGKLGQHSANRARWSRRRETMPLAGTRVRGADLSERKCTTPGWPNAGPKA